MHKTLEQILEAYRAGGENLIFLLQETQESLGYIPRDAVAYFSRNTGIAPSRFYGVATFYAQFRLTPMGKHKITACCGTACHVKGSERLINNILRKLDIPEGKDTSEDGEFTVEKVNCVGACSIAPVMIFDKEVHGKMTADRLTRELNKLRDGK